MRNAITNLKLDFSTSPVVWKFLQDKSFVRGIMEGVEWVWDNGLLKAHKVEEMKESIRRAPSRRLEQTKISVFESFINELVKK